MRRSTGEAHRARWFDALSERLPAGRVGEADDVAQAYAYLMANTFMTGAILPVDGGTALV